ncbi:MULTISPECIES: hypothetical protein [Curtobacterium]|uniref:hypothetical protein n=1 Tax=Curtobacterium TaxID=2034 RepID=UPI00217E1B49|nr:MULTISPECIES: hypothetical protein [Curtobacterium]MCS6579525.1 hypothetical protein [Curtobacterium flaccumfaciens]UXZ57462.1 hypothetical protein MXD64_15920 [Curtobacterium sp. Arg-1]
MAGERELKKSHGRPVLVQGNRVVPVAWRLLSAGVVAAGLWLACSQDVFGGAWFTRVWCSALLLFFGLLGLMLAVSTIRTRVKVFPDRLEATVNFRGTRTIRPGELARFRASGKGNDVVSAATARGRRGFRSNRFHRHYDVLNDWLDRNGGEPWVEHQAFFIKLTHQTKPQPIRNALSMLTIVAFHLFTLAMFPGLFVMNAYDSAHRERVTCTATSAEAVTLSSRSAKGVGASYAGVGFDAPDCGRLTYSKTISFGNQDAFARRYDRAPGEYAFTVGGASFWVREHAPWVPLAPEVYGVSEPGEPAAGIDE